MELYWKSKSRDMHWYNYEHWVFKPDFISILLKDDQLTLDGIKQYYIKLDEQHKQDTIIDLYQFINIGQGIIYCNKKYKADELKLILEQKDFSVGVLHGDMICGSTDSRITQIFRRLDEHLQPGVLYSWVNSLFLMIFSLSLVLEPRTTTIVLFLKRGDR